MDSQRHALDQALELDKRWLAKLVSIFEDTRVAAALQRKQILAHLAAHPRRRRAVIVGMTGTPGAGKSSLVGQLAPRLIAASADLAVAVVAVDPSSHESGGALLGDRTRVRFPAREKRLYFRSQASERELGGVSRTTFQVCRLLSHLFDVVLIETVGIGQSEIEIQHAADRTYLVLQPLAGDQIQYMKAGMMEMPDAYILNKCDQSEAARASFSALRASLAWQRPRGGGQPPLYQTSAHTGAGLDQLAADLIAVAAAGPRRDEREVEAYFFAKWIRDEYGRSGLRALGSETAESFLARFGGFDEAQLAFAAHYRGTSSRELP